MFGRRFRGMDGASLTGNGFDSMGSIVIGPADASHAASKRSESGASELSDSTTRSLRAFARDEAFLVAHVPPPPPPDEEKAERRGVPLEEPGATGPIRPRRIVSGLRQEALRRFAGAVCRWGSDAWGRRLRP